MEVCNGCETLTPSRMPAVHRQSIRILQAAAKLGVSKSEAEPEQNNPSSSGSILRTAVISAWACFWTNDLPHRNSQSLIEARVHRNIFKRMRFQLLETASLGFGQGI